MKLSEACRISEKYFVWDNIFAGTDKIHIILHSYTLTFMPVSSDKRDFEDVSKTFHVKLISLTCK
jgi:hypothetical protein